MRYLKLWLTNDWSMGGKAVICLKKIGNPVPKFRFLLDKANLLLKWQQFVNRSNWSVTKNSVICVYAL